MRTTTGRKTAYRRLGRNLRLGTELLEVRLALSAPGLHIPMTQSSTSYSSDSLTILSTLPAESSVLSSSPKSLQITFDRPLSSFSLGQSDFDLVQVASDGSTSPVPRGLGELEESLDPDGTSIDLELTSPLASGRYQIRVDPSGQLQGVDGSMLAVDGSGTVVDDFTISSAQSGPGSVTDLETIGSSVVAMPGQLNLSADPDAVQYYQFEVAPGHHWLVGLQVTGGTDGESMGASLSLFGASGRLISTSSLGVSGQPDDPYLFEGLDPGTYYVGVAAPLNIPDASGRYNASGQSPGSGNLDGTFRLEAVADVADQPTQVLGLRLNHADPQSTAPTGLTLEFSGGLSPASLASTTGSPVMLVDQSGATWSLTPTEYNAGNGQLSLVFNRPLAAGTYSIELAGTNGLLDLAGRIPVAAGLAAGTLGTFTVSPSDHDTDDLGAVLPGLGLSGLSSHVKVEPRTVTTESFVVVEPGVYAFHLVSIDGKTQFAIENSSGNVVPTSGNGQKVGYLAAGIYQFVLTTSDSAATVVTVSVAERLVLTSSLLDSGVGQIPALSLRLVTPQANFGRGSNAPILSTASGGSPMTAVSSASASSTVGSGMAAGSNSTGAMASVQSGGSSAFGLATPGSLAVAGLINGAGLVGRPSMSSNSVTVVGLSGSGLSAVASNSDSLLAGLIVATAPVAEGTGPLHELDAGALLEPGLLARSSESRREDESSLEDLDWIAQRLADALDRLAPTPVAELANATEPRPASAEGAAVIEAKPPRTEGPVAALVAPPLALGVVIGAIVIGSRRMTAKRKPSQVEILPGAGVNTVLRGPHRKHRSLVSSR